MENSSLGAPARPPPAAAPRLVAAADAPQPARQPRHRCCPRSAVLAYVRRALPGVAANRIRRGEIDALMAHWRLVTPRLADAVRARRRRALRLDGRRRRADRRARALRRHRRHLQRPAAVRSAAAGLARDRARRRRVARGIVAGVRAVALARQRAARCGPPRPSRATGSRPGRAAARTGRRAARSAASARTGAAGGPCRSTGSPSRRPSARRYQRSSAREKYCTTKRM